ncbi:MAG: DNA-3-methyladenine glycosylase 2 family protein [Tissierellia bacterium]|nr:DNA-3-methyladenine glycosylase 2 family protein [Tissierellia bacterium]
MDLIIEDNGNEIVVRNMEDLEPKHIFECGQAFRWHKEEDGSYSAIHRNGIINVRRDGRDIVFSNTDLETFHGIWYDYFDLARDYGRIKEQLPKDSTMVKAIEFANGIRILRQEPFETTVSFIISANNHIQRIRKSIGLISRNYGEFITAYRGRDYYSFPNAEVLAELDAGELETVSKIGYRAKYVVETSKMIASGEVDLSRIFQLPTVAGKEQLMRLPGVGPKVSDCILLFAFAKEDVFPIDVWVGRVMRHLYLDEDAKFKDISTYAEERFGNLAGFAQQYLFYYAREHGIGREKRNK